VVATAPALINATLAGNRIWETSLGFRPPQKILSTYFMLKPLIHKTYQKQEKIHCLEGANPALPQEEGLCRGNSRQFLVLTFWDLMGNPMNGTEKTGKTYQKKTENF